MLNMYNTNRSSLTTDQHFLTLMYYGCSLLEERQHRRADEIYSEALHEKQNILRMRTPSYANVDPSSVDTDRYTIAEIRWKLALCSEALRQTAEAIEHLNAVPIKQRTVKINMMLARLLQHDQTTNKSAALPLRAVLLQCPLNLEAVRMAIACGIKPADIMVILRQAGVCAVSESWLPEYLEAYTMMLAGRFPDAIRTFRVLLERPGIGDNETVLVLLGQLYQCQGEPEKALVYLRRAYNLNPYMSEGLMSLAALFGQTGRVEELERLTLSITAPAIYTAEYWFVLSQHLFALRKVVKAAHFVQKSILLRPKNVEAMLLRGEFCVREKHIIILFH